jgi:acetoin utilization deacetylase AcuC-like enzyme
MTTGYITHDSYKDHQLPGYNHPESNKRILAVWDELRESKLVERMTPIAPIEATRDMLRAVHTERLVSQLEQMERLARPTFIDQDTYAMPQSFQIARLAAGGTVRAVEAVVKGEVDNALAVVRPPGHHATPNAAMGFCIYSNVAIAARYANQVLGLERVMVVDYDVHHGNGTQDVFYDDPKVLFLSTHQSPFYPMTGKLNETGEGAGKGTTINIPFPNYVGNDGFKLAYEKVVWKAARRYKPQLILVSAGFDAHWVDPLAQLRLTLGGYAHLTRELIAMANELCGGKIVFVMEGGYDLVSLSHGVRNVAHALLGEDEVSDPLGMAEGNERDVTGLIDKVAVLHGL